MLELTSAPSFFWANDLPKSSAQTKEFKQLLGP
jgi:hypothetical protein